MYPRCLLTLLAATSIAMPTMRAQEPPPVSMPSGAGNGAMLATDRYLFVLRDDVLYQFDLTTLKLRHRFDFTATKDVARAGEPQTPAGDEAVAVEIHEPPQQASPAAVAASVDAALGWLAAHQDEDGRWDADDFMKHETAGDRSGGPGNSVHDVGVTGLAMLAMLGEGSTLRSGTYEDNLKRAAKWLVDQQADNGLLAAPASHDFIYDHAIAAYALCEAYGLSKYDMLKLPAQKSLDYLESHRNPYSVWRYQPRDNDNDTSVTTWALFALSSGKFFGLQINEMALRLVQTWYDQVTDASGRAGYTKRGEPSSRHPGDHGTRFPVQFDEAMTAAALAGRFLLGQDPKDVPIMKAAADRLLAKPPQWKGDRIDAYYWYMGTVAMYQMGGSHWREWSQHIATLIAAQRRDGNAAGSWDPVGVWDSDGGRVYATALYALSLETVDRANKLIK